MIPPSIKFLRNTTYSELVARLNRARAMDAHDLSQEAIDTKIGHIMGGYHTRLATAFTNGVFRARKNIGDQLFESVSELWYPPARFITRWGRFNEPGKSVFYACARGNGTVFEIRPEVGDYVTLLVIKTKESFSKIQCAHIGLERSSARGTSGIGTDLPRYDASFRRELEEFGIYNKWLAIDDFLSDMATCAFPFDKEQDKYRIANAISRILFRIPGVHVLNYPSVATNLKCINICSSPEIADQFFVPSEAWLLKTEEKLDRLPGSDKTGLFYRTRFLRRSKSIEPDGRIQWSDVLTNVRPEDISSLS